ncbi:MAG: alpha/beta hydrolase [Chloroherpetonaceae bacterium]
MTTLSLIAIHGNGGGGFRFERLKPFIPASVNFLAPTLPGFSDVKRDPNLSTMKDYAFKLREMIEQEPKPLVLLGTGIGGSIALEFLQHFERDVQGLILHAPVGTRLNQRLFPKLMKPMFIRRFGQWLFSSTLARPIFKRLLFQSPEQIPAEYLKKFFDEYRRCEAFAQMFDIINAAWFQSLRPSNIPAVLLWGEKERVLTPDQAKDYQRLLPNSTIKLVPNWNHFPMIEQPEDFARQILDLSNALIEQSQPIRP